MACGQRIFAGSSLRDYNNVTSERSQDVSIRMGANRSLLCVGWTCHQHCWGSRLYADEEGVTQMAKTKKGTKYVEVQPYERKDGTKVPRHDRSVPRPARPTTPRRSGR